MRLIPTQKSNAPSSSKRVAGSECQRTWAVLQKLVSGAECDWRSPPALPQKWPLCPLLERRVWTQGILALAEKVEGALIAAVPTNALEILENRCVNTERKASTASCCSLLYLYWSPVCNFPGLAKSFALTRCHWHRPVLMAEPT